ncbi:MAG: zinc-binding dehydrogenase [Acidimicrobiales bacterium]
MRAAQMTGPGRFEVVDAPDPVPAPGEVLVRSHAASICGSDLHQVFEGTYEGAFPAPAGYPGHEGVGRVVASRSGRFTAGDAVLTVPLPRRGGCYAELQCVGEDFLVPLPEGGDLDRLLMAQQLGTAVYAFRRYWPDGTPATGLTAAILGAGSAGLFLLQLARRAGFSRTMVADRDKERLEVAGGLGADVLVDMATQPFPEVVMAATGGVGADLVIEAAGPDRCRTACVEAVRQGGRLGFFGLPEHPGLVPFPLAAAFGKGATIEMVAGAQAEPGLRAFRDSIGLIASGAIDVDHLLEPRFPLERVQEAMEAARDHAGVKVTVTIAPGG